MKAIVEMKGNHDCEVVGTDLTISVNNITCEISVIDRAGDNRKIFTANAADVICAYIWNIPLLLEGEKDGEQVSRRE